MIRVEVAASRISVTCTGHEGWHVSLGAYSVELAVVLRAALNHVHAEHGLASREG